MQEINIVTEGSFMGSDVSDFMQRFRILLFKRITPGNRFSAGNQKSIVPLRFDFTLRRDYRYYADKNLNHTNSESDR